MQRSVKIFISSKRIVKNTYERLDYESVDKTSLS